MKIVSRITAVLTLAFIAVLAVMTFFGDKKDFSPEENRCLAAVPEPDKDGLYDGSTSVQLGSYVTDHFACRNSWLAAGSLIQTQLSESIVNGVYVTDERLIDTRNSGESIVPAADVFNSFAEDNDGMVYIVAVPTSAGVYGDVLPHHIVRRSESQQISEFYDALNSDIRRIDAYNILKMLKDNYIYYRSDTKWTVYGAYCVYKTVIQKLGMLPTAYDKFTIEHVTNSFRGDLYNRTLSEKPKADIMDIYDNRDGTEVVSCTVIHSDGSTGEGVVYDRSRLGTGDMYSMYLGESVPVMNIRTTNNSNNKLLVVKDSFGDCFVPFLLQHYSEITVVSPEDLEGKLSDYVNVGDYPQTLFLFGTDSLENREMLSRIKA